MTDAGPLDQIVDEDSDSDDLLPPTLAGGAAGESDLPGTGALLQRLPSRPPPHQQPTR
jgi:periodic tryptophan protein 2